MNRVSPWTLLVLIIGCAHALPLYDTLAARGGDLVLRVPVGWHVRPADQGPKVLAALTTGRVGVLEWRR